MDLIANERLFTISAYTIITLELRCMSVPFYIVFDQLPRLDIKKLVFVNRLLQIVTHQELAHLICF